VKIIIPSYENHRSEVIAIDDSGLMTIKKSFEFGMADRDRIGTKVERRWTSNKESNSV